MQINKISANYTFSASPPKLPEQKQTRPKQSMSAGEKYSLGLIAGGSLLVGAYFLLRGKTKTFSIYFEELKKAKFKNLNNKIKKQLQTFIPHYKEAMPESYRVTKNGKTVVQYKWQNSYGDTLTDNLVFDKNNKIIKRFIVEKNIQNGEHKGRTLVRAYKGGDKLLGKLEKLPKGACDPDYFIKEYSKSSKERVKDILFSQQIKSFDKNGNCKNGMIYTNQNNVSICSDISIGKVPTFINQDNCHDFKWGYKTREKTTNYVYSIGFENKIKGYAQQVTFQDGKPFKGKVIVKMNDGSQDEYNTMAQLFRKNKAFKDFFKF